MQSTYMNFRELSKLHQGPTDLNTLALNYQNTENPVILAFSFCQQFAYIVSQVNPYFYLTEADKSSFAVEELHKALKDYNPSKGASARTLFSRYLNRRLYAETNMLRHQKRSANNTADCFEELASNNMINDKVSDTFTSEVALLHSIETSGMFTENEIKYCKIIMRDSDVPRDSDVARLLSVSPSAINQIKKSIKQKLMNLSLNVA